MIDFSISRILEQAFEKYAEPGRFTICTAQAKIEDEVVYAAIIVENSNPRFKEITADFEKTAEVLTNKP